MKLRRSLFKLLGYLPQFVQNSVVRSLVNVSADEYNGLEFKIASSADELRQSFALVHDSYVAEGLMQPTASGIRVTKYQMMPTTAIIICKKDDTVIATMTIIRDSKLGLPSDMSWDLSVLRYQGFDIAELSSLAVAKGWRRKRASLLLPMCKYMFEYVEKFTSIDCFVATHNKIARPFYQGILLFSPLPLKKDVNNYDFVTEKKGAPFSGFLDLSSAERKFKSIYVGKETSKNLYDFFCNQKIEGFNFPVRKHYKTMDPKLTPELLFHFFKRESSLLDNLSPLEKFYLEEMYFFKEFKDVISRTEDLDMPSRRTSPRFELRLPANVVRVSNGQLINCDVKSVALLGVSLRFKNYDAEPFKIGDMLRLQFQFGNGIPFDLEIKIVWCRVHGEFTELGCKISKDLSSEWRSVIDDLEADLRTNAKSQNDQISAVSEDLIRKAS